MKKDASCQQWKPGPVGKVMFVGFAIWLFCGIEVSQSTDVLCVRFYLLSIDTKDIFFPKT
jgi:hypothetical protein